MTDDDSSLPCLQHLLVVVAHPDDESFGLGALLTSLVARGTTLSILCFTRGEHSTLSAYGPDLAIIRCEELHAASQVLGISDLSLLSYPDGGLADVAPDELRDEVLQRTTDADGFLVFDEGGVTGHPDHCRATCAALTAADTLNLPVLAWAIPQAVAEQLNAEYGTSFVGREEADLDVCLHVDRGQQRRAIACHRSQVTHNPVLWRRLELLGGHESLCYLRHSVDDTSTASRRFGPCTGQMN